jgi:hypothetical protein
LKKEDKSGSLDITMYKAAVTAHMGSSKHPIVVGCFGIIEVGIASISTDLMRMFFDEKLSHPNILASGNTQGPKTSSKALPTPKHAICLPPGET